MPAGCNFEVPHNSEAGTSPAQGVDVLTCRRPAMAGVICGFLLLLLPKYNGCSSLVRKKLSCSAPEIRTLYGWEDFRMEPTSVLALFLRFLFFFPSLSNPCFADTLHFQSIRITCFFFCAFFLYKFFLIVLLFLLVLVFFFFFFFF